MHTLSTSQPHGRGKGLVYAMGVGRVQTGLGPLGSGSHHGPIGARKPNEMEHSPLNKLVSFIFVQI